jgi:type II secretory ATPase GspE/PulE/Tfp pilus assembly ATPase PilB-like protein
VVARVKVLSGMDIAEHRLPQDGRFSAVIDERRRLDLRSSTYPTVHGEKAVLRLLDGSGLRLQLDRVGLSGPMLQTVRDLIHRPEGIVLLTGPTGSGKTSTLYAALAEIVATGKNIITIEDPVEYSLPGVNQGQTNDKAGFTFAKGLRAILRQDPDVIMVGEIRDMETLETAIEASLTGHFVLSTLHTNSAVATIARLLEMGLEPYLLASSVLGIIAQRLVRRICSTCRAEVTTPPALRAMFRDGEPTTFFRGVGCPDCRGTGFRGRIGIFEVMRLSEDLRALVLERATEIRLLETARLEGMTSLREECLALVARGETTLEEVLRVTQERR